MFRYNLSRFIFANFHWTNIQIEIFPLDVDKFLFFFFLEFFSKILQSYDITDCHRQQTDVIHGLVSTVTVRNAPFKLLHDV